MSLSWIINDVDDEFFTLWGFAVLQTWRCQLSFGMIVKIEKLYRFSFFISSIVIPQSGQYLHDIL